MTDEQILKIKEMFSFTDEDIYSLQGCFRKFDLRCRAYIDLDDFLSYFRRLEGNFAEMPYAERLFEMVEKQKEGRVFFEEFVKGVSAFCLMNREAVLRMVFDWVDADGDEQVSRQDLARALEYRSSQTQEYTFFTNFIKEIDRFPLKQNHTCIDFEHFRLNADRLYFLTWPAYRLQQQLREQVLGPDFWLTLYSKVEKKEYEIKNNEKKEISLKAKI